MDKIDEVLTRRVNKILPTKEGLKKLISSKKIKLYNGIDPTATRLHLGHTVGLRKLMEFANLGHDVTLLFGTGTVLVGDPSERNSGRKLITEKEIQENIKNWKNQVSPIVNFDKVKIKYNADWLTKLKLKDIIKIASNISAVQLFKREMFQRRLSKGDTVWYHETMYPLFQGYDSVVMDVDLEIGGSDQEFNMLVGRELQKKMNKRNKFVLTWPMIMGTDGNQMSKTSNNCVWLDDSPGEMFGKLMSVPDEQVIPYLELVTNISLAIVKDSKKSLRKGENPMNIKKLLAFQVVEEFHGKKKAKKAQDHFVNTFQERSFSAKAHIVKPDNSVLKTIAGEVGSKSKAKRLISDGAVDVNGKTITDPTFKISGGEEIKIGKKEFVKVKKR